MEISAICKCGLLLKLAEEADSLFTRRGYPDESAKYYLRFNDRSEFELLFCPFCGGKEMISANVQQKCECSLLSTWQSDPAIPIEYVEELNEYHLITRDECFFLFYYCPACGGRLPKSRRERLFTIPSEVEMTEVMEKLKGSKKIADFFRVFGEPEKKFTGRDIQEENSGDTGGIRQTFRYTSLAETFNLVVQEYEDGRVEAFFEGKPKIEITQGIDESGDCGA